MGFFAVSRITFTGFNSQKNMTVMTINRLVSRKGLILVLMALVVTSCISINRLKYFTDINTIEEPISNPREQKPIMPYDNLYVKVISIDEKTNTIFNASDEFRYGSTSMIGYLVNEKGNINFPFVGLINVAGLTTEQASTKIQIALNDYINNTAVIVKYIDNKVSILGEVRNQGTFNFTQEKLDIYQALSLGGGLTNFGDRKNVILIRHEGDKVNYHKLNLNDSRIAGKEFYYILPNDVIVVEPLKALSWTYQNATYNTSLTTITTLLAVLIFAGIRF
jgi:polysaccharide biosynthesis/export protein